MTPISLLRTRGRRALLVLVCTVLGAVAVLGLTLTQQKQYTATRQEYVTFNGANSPNQLQQGAAYTTNQMQSFGELATSARVLRPVIEQLGLTDTVSQLQKRVVATTPRGTVVLQLEVTDPDPARAARIANAVGDQFVDLIDAIGPRGTTGQSLLSVQTIETAQPPSGPSAPRTSRDVVLGAVVGLAVGAALVLLLTGQDDRVRTPGVVARTVGVPLLATIGRSAPTASGARATASAADSRLAESVSVLLRGDGPTRLMVTAPTPDCGSSVVAHQIARVLADQGRPVVVVDTQLRRPANERPLPARAEAGLADVLSGQHPVGDAVVRAPGTAYDVLGSGHTAEADAAPGERHGARHTVEGSALRAVLDDLGRRYEVVILDAGAVLTVVDPVVLGSFSDATLVVADADLTQRDELSRAVQVLGLAGVAASGVVLTTSRKQPRFAPSRADTTFAPAHSTS
ncbi:capsular polysaccharide biosynthesis protein [Friedmanniella endophytica]|uniref:Capsular polysaccharide biosynthesis protein n=1 Tax=Microlunatus kandeliicorticis TaxID=1759536 RepID=A0A7W3P492_9ACTN|nr:polysaccharide biosynthesis tyrosine autokinase [Microlunatus kandeliicorticis]MBA8792674.1 capsular polysaccharide biosynthesis protein [Microlunatus kandeliicorticis]